VSAPTLDISGSALDRLLSFGWVHDRDGLAWSDANWATLLFRVVPPVVGDALTMKLRLRGLAANPSAAQPVMIEVAGSAPIAATLSDHGITEVKVRVPLGDTWDGIVRVALNIPYSTDPSDPSRRGAAAPVRHAGVVLQSIDVRVGAPGDAEPRD
jgi:hypothetical protein